MEEFIEKPVEVYIKINESNEIIEVTSSEFLDDATGYIKIDEGFGDKYRHAQSQYFQEELINYDRSYNYKYENNKLIKNKK